MEKFYNEELYNELNKSRVKLRNIYIVLLVVALLLVISGIVYITLLPYNTTTEKVLTAIIITFAVLFSFFSFIYFSIPYARLSSYQKFIYECLHNDTVVTNVTILNVDYNDFSTKYGVDYYHLNVLEWSSVHDDYLERSILVDKEIKVLKVKEGEIIEVETSGNRLIAYEIKGE